MLTFLYGVMVLSAAWVGFAYVGYPLVLLLLARLAPRPVHASDDTPPVSVVIAVHDGERELPEKLRNVLASAYPGELEVIVASDHSTDRTEEIATSTGDDRVRLVRNHGARGKESAQAAGIAEARGEILVFTDVSARWAPDALRNIVRPFGDATVGCVSSEDEVDSNGGEGAYVRFEMTLRRLENVCGGLIGLSGSFFAARRSLCDPWPTDLASDFRTALEASRRGLRAVAEPTARASFRAVEDAAAEWPRKVRTVRRGLAVLSAYRDLLHPRHGRVALSLWGHKVMRFTSPAALAALLVASGVAAPQSAPAAVLFVVQAVFYGLGGLALVSAPVQRLLVPRLAGFFMLVNASMAVAWAYHLSGQRSVQWQPTRR
jgi:cellulose synthase/poly-beta-1,6-N-acetylglucosamine synthase-like glycosyltransferase